MTGQEIRDTLERAGVLPSKQLGQNFLIDPNMSRWIVSQLDLRADDTVLEVGPGTGSLTEHLLGKVKHIILVEFDARLVAALMERYKGRDDIEIHHADGAKFDRRLLFQHRPIKFLGNLPYSSGGAILKNLLSRPHPFSRAVIMLQKEVIERLAASPGTKDYGILSLRMQVNWNIQGLRTVPPDAFHPRPKIDSSVAVLTPRNPADTEPFDSRLFDELIRRGFAQRRKQLKKQLPENPPFETVATQLGIPPTVRAEELDLARWIEITRAYDPHPLKDTAQKGTEIFDVVDGADQVTGQASRAEVHSKNLLHRAIHVFVENKRGDILLQKRSHLKDTHPSVWDSGVSGHLDSGEDYLPAAIRELHEEMGINPEAAPTEIARLSPAKETGWEHIRLFHTRHQGNLSYPAAEIETATFFPPEQIDAWTKKQAADFSPAFLVCWEKFRDA